MNIIKLLRKNKNFRLLWFANTLSTIGDFVDDIAFAQVVYMVTESTLMTSYVFAIKILLTFLSIFTATYIDRHSKKIVILISEIGQAILLLFFILAYRMSLLNTALLIVFSTTQTIFSTFVIPANNSIITYLVEKNDLLHARAVMSIIMQLIQVLAYALAGMLLSFVGITGAVIIDVATFTLAFILTLQIKEPINKHVENKTKNTFFIDVKDGFVFVVKNRLILGIVISAFIGNFGVSPIDSIMPAFFTKEHLGSNYFSVFMTFIAVGSIIGSLLVSAFKDRLNLQWMYSLGFAFGSLGFLLLIKAIPLVIIIGATLLGISMGGISVLTSTILLIYSPKEMTGRVFSIFKAITYIASPLGILIVGALGEIIAIRSIMFILAMVLLVNTIFSFNLLKHESYTKEALSN